MIMIMIMRKTVITKLILIASVLLASNVLSADYLNDAKQYLEKGDYQAAMIQLKNKSVKSQMPEKLGMSNIYVACRPRPCCIKY